MSLVGDPDRPPTKLYDGIIQYWTGGQAFAGTMAALLWKEITGQGQQVDVSILETVAYHTGQNYLQYQYKGEQAQRTGNRAAALGGMPTVYQASDGYIHAYARPFAWMAELIGREELLRDPRFSPELRNQHGAELGDLIKEFVRSRPKEDLFRLAQNKRLPWAPLNTPADVVSSEHLRSRSFFKAVEHSKTGRLDYPGSPVSMGDTQVEYKRAPLLGEHNMEVYCGLLHHQKEELVRLRANGVI